MAVVVCWLVFPVVFGLVCLGCGLALEAAAGMRLPRQLVLPAGLAVTVVIAQFTTWSSATAALTTPAVLLAAVAGIAMRPPWRTSWRALRWPLAAAVGVYAVFAAPVVLSGQATFAGYIKLDDTATWFALTDRVMGHGRDLSDLPVSTYFVVLRSYLGGGYPVGAFLPLGVGHQLVGQDIAWIFQPYMAFLAAMISLCLFWLVRGTIGSSRMAALAAFAAPQAALLYGYALWGGVKEMAVTALVALTAALAADASREARTGRQVLPLAAATAAGLSTMSAGAALWLGPLLLGSLVVTHRYQRRDVPVRQVVAFAPFALALSAPAIAAASSFVSPSAKHTLTASSELGNLGQPLKPLQALGIWPTADFRMDPTDPALAHVLMTVLVGCGLLGLMLAWRRRSWELPLFVLGVLVGLVVVVHFGSPWVDGKALATASPAFVLAGMAGAGALLSRGRRVESAVLCAAILGGVLWSNALAYRGVSLAPRPQLAELERIGHRIAGQGPTLMTDYEPYGVRHFLRAAAPEGASEFRWRPDLLRDGSQLEKGQSADLDRFALSTVLTYRTLVVHRSPVESRPPAGYRLAWHGNYYEEWQRSATTPPIVNHLSLGGAQSPGAVPPCANVLAMASQVPSGGSLAAVIRQRPTVIPLVTNHMPTGWVASAGVAGSVLPGKPGSIDLGAIVPRSGVYSLWLGGSFSPLLRVYVDGRLVASRRNALEWEEYQRLGRVSLSAGTVHDVRLVYDGADLHPGSADTPSPIGPLVLAQQLDDAPVTYVAPTAARSLCGKYLDWVEALGPAS